MMDGQPDREAVLRSMKLNDQLLRLQRRMAKPLRDQDGQRPSEQRQRNRIETEERLRRALGRNF